MSERELPKYARWEHERKFLIPSSRPRPWASTHPWEIADRYLEVGRLRLRCIPETASGHRTFKLCKKFSSDSAYSQAIVNIYLSSEEYTSLRDLPGRDVTKRRFHAAFEGHTFGIDVFDAELEGLVLGEVEASSLEELMKIEFPPYAAAEVTEDSCFTGGALSRTTAAELAVRLRAVSA